MFWSKRVRGLFSAVLVALSCVALSPGACGQELTLGVVAGANLSDDFRPTTSPYFLGATQHISDASQWFMVGPTLELSLHRTLSVEMDALWRRIGSKRVIELQVPLSTPPTTLSFGPFFEDAFTWQFSLLGKYRIATRGLKPFVEAGTSHLPQESKNQTGITIGSGAEMHLWRMIVAPTLRYTRWLNNENPGGVSDQFQLVAGVYEPSESMQPRVFGRPVSLGVVSAFAMTELLDERFDLASRSSVSSEQNTVVGGSMIELPLFKRFLLEVNGLYRPAHTISGLILTDGSVRNGPRAAFLTWEIPMLVKYRKVSRLAPTFELGPSFRTIGHANSNNYSHRGITAGVGVSAQLIRLNIAPTIRYTHWGSDNEASGLAPSPATRQNQLELVFGFSF